MVRSAKASLQRAPATWRRIAWCLPVAFSVLSHGALASAQAPPPTVTENRVEQEGRTVTDPLILSLIETRVGAPLSVADVRESITHLTSLTLYEDVQVYQEPAGSGARVRYVLLPIHAVDRLEFRGTLGLPEGDLRRAIAERFGPAPPASRAEEVIGALQLVYRDRGYLEPHIAPGIEITHDPDRASMVLQIDSGPRAVIRDIEFDAVSDDQAVFANTGIHAGQPYDAAVIQGHLQKYETTLRARGFYEAAATHTVAYAGNGAIVRVSIDRGPHVSVAFSGDPLPQADRDRLVPIRAEGSADEDLLEDSSRAIEDYFHDRGYREAMATYVREESPQNDELTIRFTIARGPRYVVDSVSLNGSTALPAADLAPVVRMKPGDLFVQATLDAAVSAIRNLYRSRGFTHVTVMPGVGVLPPNGNDRHVEVSIDVTEGPRTLVGAVEIAGNMVLSEAEIRPWLTVAPGRAYSEVDVASDRDRIDLEYRNRGYETVLVEPRVMLADGDTGANITFAISEGPQVFVDHVIIIGNRRTSTRTIERELTLKSGQPLGYGARIESQQRLSALGLFRRITITELQHESEPRRDVLIRVEEAPPTTIGYGGGLEGSTKLRPTGPNGQPEERFEFAPRGSFDIGRSNLWGKNRSVDLFARASLKSRDVLFSDTGERLATPGAGSGYGFNEYRVLGTYREPRAFNLPADILLTGILDQAIRSSFSFRSREVRAEAGWHVTRTYSMSGRYSFQHTMLFDQRFTPEEDPVLIDRFFPQVRLSKLSHSVIRDTRDDLLDPARGTLFAVNSDVAGRAIGSEVGFIKTFVQLFDYYRLPGARRIILATAARVGASHGFPRTVQVVNPDGTVTFNTVRDDLPASERFFAGGDTTVRGFSLDRLGTIETISTSGFPTGGNGEVVVNAELRVAAVKGFTAVTFLDAGNVFPHASDLSFTDLRPAAGFGLHYRSPIGPIRVELGFNLHPRELVPGVLERRSVLHVSLGQAF
jgi:outer membrane protein assembly complex protein YaeT